MLISSDGKLLPEELLRQEGLRSGTHRTRGVAVLVPPARRAGAGAVGRVTGGAVGALTRLVAAESPGAAGAGDGAVHALPTWSQTQTRVRASGLGLALTGTALYYIYNVLIYIHYIY